ncbi:hypothetical protein [Mucilaginibacter sp.]|uniref:hypothetical protein n=1 Tax=Mucilaginibacter sp. TaxID=1882438 RepID=UPI00262FB6E6|nr:hypothetical protein [Mucilaginibacter sp.]
MKKRLIMLMILSAVGLQEFAYGMQQQQDTTKKQKKHWKQGAKKDTTKKDTIKPIKP